MEKFVYNIQTHIIHKICLFYVIEKLCTSFSQKLINFWFYTWKYCTLSNTNIAWQCCVVFLIFSVSQIHVNLLLPKGWSSFGMLDSFEWVVGRVEGSKCPGTPNRRGSKQHSLKEKSINKGWWFWLDDCVLPCALGHFALLPHCYQGTGCHPSALSSHAPQQL